MSKRAECTIFLITQKEIMRADFSGKQAQKCVGFEHHDREPGQSMAMAVGTLLNSNPKVGRRAVVFDSSVWSQIVSLPTRGIEDIAASELLTALKFEVETLAGIEADQASIGVKKLSIDTSTGQTSFWLNVAPSLAFEEIKSVLKAAGAKWVGLAHPLGNGHGFASQQNKRQTVEVWEDVVGRFQLNVPDQIVGNSGNFVEQLGFANPTQLMSNATVVSSQSNLADSIESLQYIELGDSSNWQTWAQHAAANVLKDLAASLPVIRTSEKSAHHSIGLMTVARIAAFGMIALFCFWHWNWLATSQKQVEAEIEELQVPAREKAAFDSQLAGILEQRSALELDANETQLKMKKIEFLLMNQTERLHKLLELLKQKRTVDLVISKIEPHEDGIVVSGLTLTGNSAPEFAKVLREEAQPLGWNIHPPTQNGEQKLVSGGPWQFSILFEDVGPGSPVINDEPKEKSPRVSTPS